MKHLMVCMALLSLGRAAGAERLPAHLQPVETVTALTDFKYSVVLRWKTLPKTAPLLAGYLVEWWDEASPKAVKRKWTRAAQDRTTQDWNAFQIQELHPGEKIAARITPVDREGRRGAERTITGLSPTGKWEQSLAEMTGNSGFLYLPEKDTPMVRPDPKKIATNQFGMRIHGEESDPTRFGHTSVAVNHQQHWHILGNDKGVGSITCRLQQPMTLDGKTRHLRLDCDIAPFVRAGWYIVFTPEKRDQFKLFFNNGDDKPDSDYPQIRMKFASRNLEVSTYANRKQTYVSKTTSVRGATYPNVRQYLGVDLSKDGLTFLADKDYDGTLEPCETYPVDLSAWGGKCYVYIIYSLYNNRKGQPEGINAQGAKTCDNQTVVWHLGNVAFDGPAAQEPVTPQPFDPLFHSMPTVQELHGWSIPKTKVTNPSSLWKGTVTLRAEADNLNSAMVTGEYVPMTKAWLLVGGKPAWEAPLGDPEIGLLQFSQDVSIDTARLKNGYYPLQFVAQTLYGTKGVNLCWSGRFTKEEGAYRVLVYNAPPQTAPGTITAAEISGPLLHGKSQTTVSLTEGERVSVTPQNRYNAVVQVKTRAPLASFDVWRENENTKKAFLAKSVHPWQALKGTDSTGVMTYEFRFWIETFGLHSGEATPFWFSILDGDGRRIERRIKLAVEDDKAETAKQKGTPQG